MFRLETKNRQVPSSSLGMQADVTGPHSHSRVNWLSSASYSAFRCSLGIVTLVFIHRFIPQLA